MFDGVLPCAERPQQEDSTIRAPRWPLVLLVSTIAILFLLAGAIYPEAFTSPVDRF